ncbi:MAG: VTT domain-containing protein [Spirochaetaceae bacterium]|nr:VTT domain-containing protein [Spirochaetaceae bacterium]
MSEIWLTGLLTSYRALAIPLSLLVEIIIAVLGFIPSFFITAANVAVFGVWWGTGLSIVGESVGAVVAFVLYRRGLDRIAAGSGSISTGLEKRMRRLSEAPEGRAFALVLAFRLLPYIPSGVVTLGAAGGRMRAWTFTAASTLGKIPALAVEVATVTVAMRLPLKGFLAILAGGILIWVMIEILRNRRKTRD